MRSSNFAFHLPIENEPLCESHFSCTTPVPQLVKIFVEVCKCSCIVVFMQAEGRSVLCGLLKPARDDECQGRPVVKLNNVHYIGWRVRSFTDHDLVLP